MASTLKVDTIQPNTESTVTVSNLTATTAAISAGTATLSAATITTATINGGTVTGITDLVVADGGTGVSTLADGGLVVGNGTSAVEVVAAGATTEILVGGGASTNPVWTTATGSGAPVRGTAPTITTINLSGGQIIFPATQAASSDANTLDDYEEGSWTPVLTFGTPGDLAVVYSTQVARYIKIGRLVTISFSIVTSTFTHTTASGVCQITGIPFASVSVAGLPYVGGCTWRGITKANFTDVNPFVDTNASVITFYISGSGQVQTTVATGDMPTGGTVTLAGTVTYFAAN